MYFVYILFSEKDQQLYTGYTTDLDQRIKYHNYGKVISTANRRPLKLIFCESYINKIDAQRRKKYFKTTPGKKAIKFMLRETLNSI